MRAVEAVLAEAEERICEEMVHGSNLRLNSLFATSEEAVLVEAVVTSTPLRRSRSFSLPALNSSGFMHDTGYDTLERAYNDDGGGEGGDEYDSRK